MATPATSQNSQFPELTYQSYDPFRHSGMIQELGRSTFDDEFMECFYLTLLDADKDSIVVLHKRHVIAFALLFKGNRFGLPLGTQNPDCLELAYLVVDTAFQGQGIGSTLLQKVKELSPLVILEVSNTNPDAERLYARHGFERWRRMYTQPNHGYLMGWAKSREDRLDMLRFRPQRA